MSRLKPINPAQCPRKVCRSKDTRRIGFSKSRNASLWRCKCGEVFTVQTFMAVKK